MKKYGVENVRGGSFCKTKLDENEMNTINKMLFSTTNKCFNCSESGHYESDCYANKHIKGHLINDEKETDSSEEYEDDHEEEFEDEYDDECWSE